MNISYKWLKRYIDFDMTPKDLAAALTSLGLECDNVEEVETVRGGLRGLVIGRVLTCTEHPDSDHLHITTVDVGAGEPLQIVCGAPNVAAGQTVVVAVIGTHLYDGDKEFVIKKSKMRGVESFGMICAEDEIGLGTSHDGIMVLPDDVAPGTPAAQYFNVESDYMLEVELTPNRVDGASHYGVARDLKAYLARHNFGAAVEKAKEENRCDGTSCCETLRKIEAEVEIPEVRLPSEADFTPDRAEGATPVEVIDTEGCPRYCGVTIRGVKVAESPEWLRNLLIAAGQRPINNIVDITNFVLLGLGQPLHSFDLDKVAGGKIVVRICPEGTPFVTLDGEEHKLSEADLMICDAEKPMCIAGVFGGLDSGITEETTDVFIESAYFNPTRVRRTARRHGLSTDASFRYERGTDPNITVYAARLAASLIRELAGGEICGNVSDNYPHPVSMARVSLSVDYVNRLIGKVIPLPLIRVILRALEITILPESTDETLELEIPTYRVDVYRPCDVVEEILRVYGYNNVEISDEMHANLSQRGATDFSYEMQNLISEQLTAQGYSEIMNNSLTAISYYADNEEWKADECVRVINPLSQDLSVMRRTLLYGGLESIAHNVNRRIENLKLYEFGNVYDSNPKKEISKEYPLAPFSEHPELALWLSGRSSADTWNTKGAELDVYELKSAVEAILRRLGIPAGLLQYEQTSDSVFAVALDIKTRQGKLLGRLGALRNAVLKQFEIEQPVCYAALQWKALMEIAARNEVLFKPLPKAHPVKRDLAMLLDASIPFAKVEETIRRAGGKLLREVTLFDVYDGKGIPEGKKSYAVSMTLQDDEKTLVDKQIDAIMKKVMASVEKQLGAQIR